MKGERGLPGSPGIPGRDGRPGQKGDRGTLDINHCQYAPWNSRSFIFKYNAQKFLIRHYNETNPCMGKCHGKEIYFCPEKSKDKRFLQINH